MKKKNIAIVCGGYSKEEIVSLKSAKQIEQTIDTSIFEVYTVLINKQSWVVKNLSNDIKIDKNDFSFILKNKKIVFDAVFMAIHGTPGEDGKLQSYFELLNIPLTTCNSQVSALTFNKNLTKIFLKEHGVISAKAIMLRTNDKYSVLDIVNQLNLPIFVKPNNGGSSFGITKVKETKQLPEAIKRAFNEDDEIIIEEFIEGREFTCGIFVTKKESIILPITEIISETDFFDYKAKYEGLSKEITPAKLTEEQTNRCKKLTLHIYKTLNCSGVIRIDYLLKDDTFYFMEVNTVPGMSAESIIPQQIKASGLTVKSFYTKLVNDALLRSGKQTNH